MDNFQTKRRQLWTMIEALLNTQELRNAQQARRLLEQWITQYPDDYYSQDGGEELAMMEEALTLLEAEKVAEPVAA